MPKVESSVSAKVLGRWRQVRRRYLHDGRVQRRKVERCHGQVVEAAAGLEHRRALVHHALLAVAAPLVVRHEHAHALALAEQLRDYFDLLPPREQK